MNPNANLLVESPNIMWSFEKTTPLPATGSFYSSRIYTSNINLNPLVAACDQLFGLLTTLEVIEYPEDSNKFLQDLAYEIRSFEHRAQLADYPSNIIVASRYALCCLVDEAIAKTAWGQKNNWSQKNLLSLFHNENYGGVRFFFIIDRALENIAQNLHLIELLYLCLNFGFTGKYQQSMDKQYELTSINNKLYQIISQYGSRNPKNLLIHNDPISISENPVISNSSLTTIDPKKLFWLTTGLAVILSGLIYLGIDIKLNHMIKPICDTIEQISKNKV